MTTILYIISFASIKKDFKNLSLISAPVIVAVVMHPMHLGLLINYDLKTDILRVFSKTFNTYDTACNSNFAPIRSFNKPGSHHFIRHQYS